MKLKKIVGLVLIFILLAPLGLAYKGNFTIEVDERGVATINSNTNYPDMEGNFETEKYTSKEEGYWLFNLTTTESFEKYKYELYLPEHSEINYLKTTPELSIEETGSQIKLTGQGESKPLSIVVQYQVDYRESFFNYTTLFIILSILVVSGFIGILLYIYKYRQGDIHYNFSLAPPNDPKEINEKELTERQAKIIGILREGKVTQKELEERLKLPKSSISRNLQSLYIKGYIKKERKGLTNYLRLAEK